MRLRTKFAYVVLGASLVFGACSKSEEPAEKVNPTLSITGSTDQLFAYNESVQTLAIETNQKDLKVSSNQNWLTATLENGVLTIVAEANLTNQERKGQITLSSDNIVKVIEVRQYALSYSLSTQKLEAISAKGDRKTFTISTLLKGVEVSSPNDWIMTSVNSDNPEEVIVVVSENPTKEARTGTVVLSVKGQPFAEVAVDQLGKGDYLLPSLSFGSVPEAIKTFESGRGSSVVRENEFGEGGTQIVYKVKDDIFGQLTYTFTLEGYSLAALYAKNTTFTEEDRAAFEEFLITQGYEKRKSMEFANNLAMEKTEMDVYVKDSEQTKIYYIADTRNPYYSVSYSPYQTANIPTLSALPSLPAKGATKAEVEAFEAANGGTYDASRSQIGRAPTAQNSDLLYYSVSNGGRLKWRLHYVYYPTNTRTKNLTQTTLYYDVESIAFYKGLDGKYYLTREFLALAQREGWTYNKRESNGAEVFKKTEGTTTKTMYVLFRKVSEELGWLLDVRFY